jgi:PAS domain-containing protein
MIETRQNAKLLSASLTFLNGGGEMGALIRAHDWSNSSLGHPENWPQPLRTAIRFLLNTGHPMYVWWGPDLLCFYNDAYRRSIGPERHPGSLGRPAREVWAEIWDIIGPQIDHVMMGRGATWQENALVPITRNGRLEEVYWTYSYGPIDDEAAPNGIGGILVVCTETTEQVVSRRRATEDIERLAQLFQQAPGFVALLRGADHVFELANPAYIKLAGRSDLIGRPVRSVFPDIEGQGFFELLDNVFASGEAYSTFGAAITLQPSPDVPTRKHLIDFVYQPIRTKTEWSPVSSSRAPTSPNGRQRRPRAGRVKRACERSRRPIAAKRSSVCW